MMDGTIAARRATGLAMALALTFGTCVPMSAAHAAGNLATATTTEATAETTAYAHEFELTSSSIVADGTAYDAKTTGDGYEISKNLKLTITEPGTYHVTGTRTDVAKGIAIEATDVKLVLDDLTLSTTDEAPISVKKGMSAALDIENTVTLTDKETDASNDNDPDGAAIKVKKGATATITGSGTLNANGNLKNGIKGAAEAQVIVGASASDAVEVNVTAAKNGIASDGSITVNGGNVNVTAVNDGIKSEPEGDDSTSAGSVTVNGGNVTIEAGGDGIQADFETEYTDDDGVTQTTDKSALSQGKVTMNGGTINITSACDGIQAANELDIEDGAVAITAGEGSATKLMSNGNSCKGLKSDKLVRVNGGTFNLDTADDCIHSDGDVELYGGTFTLQTHDSSTKPDNMSSSSTTVYEKGGDAVHADYVTTIGKDGVATNPVITTTKCYEGIEGAEVNIAGGTVKVTAADDGINAANSDLTNYAYKVAISGGDVLVVASGDGIDSNGTAAFTGGKVEVYSNGNGAEEAIDCDGTWTVADDVQLLAVGGVGVDWKVPASGLYVNFGASGTGAGQGQPGGFGQGGQSGTTPGGFGGGNIGSGTIGQGDQNGANIPGGFGNSSVIGSDTTGQDSQSGFGGNMGGNASGQGGFGGNQRSTRVMSADADENSSVDSDATSDDSTISAQAMGGSGRIGGIGGGFSNGTSIIQAAQKVVVADESGNELYSTTAAGNGTTAFFASPSLVSGATYTLSVDGSSIAQGVATEGTASGTTGQPDNGQQPGGNQQPGGAQPDNGQQSGNTQPNGGQQPGGSQQPDGNQQPGSNQSSQQPGGSQQPGNNQQPGGAQQTGQLPDNGQPEQQIGASAHIDLSTATVSAISNKTYTGKAITPKPTVTVNGTTLTEGVDYTLSYANNTSVGTATVVITALNTSSSYTGSTTATFTIVKSANTMLASTTSKSIAASKLTTTSKKLKAITVTGAKGTVKYTRVSGSKCLKVNSAGKIVVAKGTTAGKYTIKVKVRASGNANYKAKTLTKTIRVTVR